MKHQNKLSIIIPVYNESATVQLILDKIKDVQLIENIEKEILIINDASIDNSKSIILKYINDSPNINILYLENQKNDGKGASIQKGISKATGDFIVIQDADLEYDPNDFNTLLQPILKDNADVVYGSRFTKNNPKNKIYSLHFIGNKILTFLSNQFISLKLTDMETCYKLFKADVLKSIKLSEKRFGFEPEVTAKIARIKNIRVKEVMISYKRRRYSEGKKITWKDGIRTIYCIVKYGLFKLN